MIFFGEVFSGNGFSGAANGVSAIAALLTAFISYLSIRSYRKEKFVDKKMALFEETYKCIYKALMYVDDARGIKIDNPAYYYSISEVDVLDGSLEHVYFMRKVHLLRQANATLDELVGKEPDISYSDSHEMKFVIYKCKSLVSFLELSLKSLRSCYAELELKSSVDEGSEEVEDKRKNLIFSGVSFVRNLEDDARCWLAYSEDKGDAGRALSSYIESIKSYLDVEKDIVHGEGVFLYKAWKRLKLKSELCSFVALSGECWMHYFNDRGGWYGHGGEIRLRDLNDLNFSKSLKFSLLRKSGVGRIKAFFMMFSRKNILIKRSGYLLSSRKE